MKGAHFASEALYNASRLWAHSQVPDSAGRHSFVHRTESTNREEGLAHNICGREEGRRRVPRTLVFLVRRAWPFGLCLCLMTSTDYGEDIST